MFIQNISAETQTSVETYLFGIGKITVAPSEIFQTDDEQGIWLATAYKHIFAIVGVYGGAGEANTASNLGAGEGLFYQKLGIDLEFKSLIAGTAISFVVTNDDITINSSAVDNSMSNLGAGEGIYYQEVAGDFEMKSLIAGTNISFVVTNDDITINGAAPGETNTMSNLGAGAGIYFQKTGVDFEMKSLIAGTNITLDVTADDITINSTGAGTIQKYSTDFVASTGATIAAATHGCGAEKSLIVAVYEDGTPNNLVEVDISVADNGDVTWSSVSAFSGHIVIMG